MVVVSGTVVVVDVVVTMGAVVVVVPIAGEIDAEPSPVEAVQAASIIAIPRVAVMMRERTMCRGYRPAHSLLGISGGPGGWSPEHEPTDRLASP